MDNKIEILNGGYVLLVESMGSDLSVVRSARVSYDAEWRAYEEDLIPRMRNFFATC